MYNLHLEFYKLYEITKLKSQSAKLKRDKANV